MQFDGPCDPTVELGDADTDVAPCVQFEVEPAGSLHQGCGFSPHPCDGVADDLRSNAWIYSRALRCDLGSSVLGRAFRDAEQQRMLAAARSAGAVAVYDYPLAARLALVQAQRDQAEALADHDLEVCRLAGFNAEDSARLVDAAHKARVDVGELARAIQGSQGFEGLDALTMHVPLDRLAIVVGLAAAFRDGRSRKAAEVERRPVTFSVGAAVAIVLEMGRDPLGVPLAGEARRVCAEAVAAHGLTAACAAKALLEVLDTDEGRACLAGRAGLVHGLDVDATMLALELVADEGREA